LKKGGFAPPPPPPRMAPQSGDSFGRFGSPIRLLPSWEAPNLLTTRVGGGCLGLPSRGLSPKHKKYSFLPCSPYLHDISLMFFMVYSPLDTALLLALLQPSVMATFGCVAQKAASAAQEPLPFSQNLRKSEFLNLILDRTTANRGFRRAVFCKQIF
jgi:hypothetical protein